MAFNIGLRFRHGDARVLFALAERVKRGEIAGGAEIFTKAAEAARSGEPLVVLCEHPDEAKLMAAGYAQYGIRTPAVELLSA